MKHPYLPVIFKKGYMGGSKYKTRTNGKHSKIYQVWHDMLKRSYGIEWLAKYPTYRGCSVTEEWLNFQNFAKWFEKNYIEGYQLDKDVLYKNNKLYSPETCCFIPHNINKLLTKHNKDRGQYPLGVCKGGNRYKASVFIDGKTINLGSYKTSEEAFYSYKKVKEDIIKAVANRWKDKISDKVYEALMNYQVEITD